MSRLPKEELRLAEIRTKKLLEERVKAYVDQLLDPVTNTVLARFWFGEYLRKARAHPDCPLTNRLQKQARISAAVKAVHAPSFGHNVGRLATTPPVHFGFNCQGKVKKTT